MLPGSDYMFCIVVCVCVLFVFAYANMQYAKCFLFGFEHGCTVHGEGQGNKRENTSHEEREITKKERGERMCVIYLPVTFWRHEFTQLLQ